MALYSRKEFRELVGISNANVSTYLKRSQLYLDPETGKFDSEHHINKDFIQNRKSKLPPKQVVSDEPEGEDEDILKSSTVISSKNLNPRVKKAADKATIEKFEIELKKSNADLEKKLIDTELARKKLEILQEQNVPVDLVKNIISQLSRTFINNYKSFSEQLINEVCHQHGIPDNDRVKILSKLVVSLNNLHQKAVGDARKQMSNALGQTKLAELDGND